MTHQPPTTGSDGREGGAAMPADAQPPVTLVLLDRVRDGDGSSVDGLVGIADRELTPAAAATWHELERRFAAAVDLLDDLDRQIVLLRHFEHLSTADAAEILGLSKPAAGMRYLRAMRRLRSLLDGGLDGS